MKKFTKTTSTPGPWRVSSKKDFKHTNDLYHQIVALDGPELNGPGFSITGCIDIHDAKLIAAAPDLLEAVGKMMESLNQSGSGFNWNTDPHVEQAYQLCKNAYKKATE